MADNRIAELAEMDNEILAEVFKSIGDNDVYTSLTGYEFEEVRAILSNVDDVDIDLFFS